MAGLQSRPMTKFPHHSDYPPSITRLAEAALLTVWSSLSRYHGDLVLVGGLAVRLLSSESRDGLPSPVTGDVDLGITLGASGGQYGTITSDLQGQGFRFSEGRFARVFDGLTVYVDFLTEHPTAGKGSVMVDDMPVSVFLGIDRALALTRRVPLEGPDFFGAKQRFEIPVAEIGPLLILKLLAFASRQQPKDAYDILYATLNYPGGPQGAVAGFRNEESQGNRGYSPARSALEKFFRQPDHSAPVRAASFVMGPTRDTEDYRIRHRQVAEDLVTVGRALLGA